LSRREQYDCKTPFINKAFSRFAQKNSKLSSAKRRWLTIGADGATVIPLRIDDLIVDFNRHERLFAARRNK
jgi:hypothetical protein